VAKLVLDGKTVRALAVIGGRKLTKVVDSLLARLKEVIAFRDMKTYSNGKSAFIEIDGKKIRVEIVPKEPEVSSGYFRFQDGTVAFIGPEADVLLIKNALFEIAKERAGYILDMYPPDQLAYYDLTPEFIRNLPKRIDGLEIEG